jgi:hypothetical protein
MVETPTSGNASAAYVAPVHQLLTIGDPHRLEDDDWPDYVAKYGLTEADRPELIRMMFDQALAGADFDGPLVWAQVHAWRALGQLRLVTAIGPLIDFMNLENTYCDENAGAELPVVFGLIGPPAIAPLSDFVLNPGSSTSPASLAMYGLKEIAARHPDQRATCIDTLLQVLRSRGDADPSVAGFAVSTLIDMAAVEAIDPIREAFRKDVVDFSVAGDIEDVEIALGLRQVRATPKPNYHAQYEAMFERSDLTVRQEQNRVPVQSAKIGRNEPCPCGSGKKYKKCCMP